MLKLDTLDGPITNEQLRELTSTLNNLQGNILRSHGRDRSVHIFLRFHNGKSKEAKEWIAKIAERITSTQQQLDDAEKYDRGNGPSGGLFCCFFLSAKGYEALGIPEKDLPPDPDGAFRQGMEKSQLTLNDPPKDKWDPEYQGRIDAMLLLADDDEQALFRACSSLEVQEIAKICAIEYGRVIRHPQTRQTFEHFGYADGRSQPLFFKKDVTKETEERDGTDRSRPGAGPSLVLVEDPNGAPYSQGIPAYGSYLVFRKLEQRVRDFQDHLDELAKILGLQGHDRQRVDALVMGRFRDGTPVVLQSTPGQYDPVANNFDFTNDSQGLRCPFQAHIRRVNPRGERDRSVEGTINAELPRLLGAAGPEERDGILNDLAKKLQLSGAGLEERELIQSTLKAALERVSGAERAERYRHKQSILSEVAASYDERRHRIARRSVPYGTRRKEPYDNQSRDDLPIDGVGLLFMCYQGNIRQQFEFIQANWANNENFLEQGRGLDAIIGRPSDGQPAAGHNWPQRWNAQPEEHKALDFRSFVTLKGGEYFFAPSIPFLRNIAQIGAP